MAASILTSDSDIRATGFFVLRVPLLATTGIKTLADVTEGVRRHGLTRDESIQAISEHIFNECRRPETTEALYAASPSLYKAFHEPHRSPRRARSIAHSMYSYYIRMIHRPTPFGYMAGVCVGRVGKQTTLAIDAGAGTFRKHARIDLTILYAAIDRLASDARVQRTLGYRINTSLHRTPMEARFVQGTKDSAGKREYNLNSVDVDSVLGEVLDSWGGRSHIPHKCLLEDLLKHGPSPAECEGYISALVEAQILIPAAEPPLTSRDHLQWTIDTYAAVDDADKDCLKVLRDARSIVDRINGSRLGASLKEHIALDTLIADAGFSAPRGATHAEIHTTASGVTISTKVVEALLESAEIASRFGARRSESVAFNPDATMAAFANKFIARYGDEFVPLLEALDDDRGIGWDGNADTRVEAGDLLSGFHFEQPRESKVSFGPEEQALLRVALRARDQRVQVVTLDHDDIEAITGGRPSRLPKSFSLLAQLEADGSAALDRGDFTVFIQGILGASGAAWLGRFADGNPELYDYLVQHLRDEAEVYDRDEALLAEIVHLPAGRVGNIVARPKMRPYEIAFLGAPAADPDHTIMPADLLVGVRRGQVLLYSSRLQKRIIPRLSCAHYPLFYPNLGVYNFLFVLQHQQDYVPGFDWGSVAGALAFVPRVVVGRTVLSLARWVLSEQEVRDLTGAAAVRDRSVEQLRQVRSVPRYVTFDDSDQKLLIDLENPLAVDVLASCLSKGRGRTLTEVYPDVESQLVTGPAGKHNCEIIVPFVNRTVKRQMRQSPPPSTVSHSAMLPGGEWAYVKIYGSENALEKLLIKVLPRLIRTMRDRVDLTNWHFVRYRDPDAHLRLRFHSGNSKRLWQAIRALIGHNLAPLVQHRSFNSVSIDTFLPEAHRYGGAGGLALSTKLFTADSDAALSLISVVAGNPDLRLTAALMIVMDTIAATGWAQHRRLSFVHKLRRDYGDADKHARFASENHRAVGGVMRSRRDIIRALIAGDRPVEVRAVLDERRRVFDIGIPEVLSAVAAGDLSQLQEDVLGSHIHMSMNRIFDTRQREHEFVIYSLVERIYRSQAAQEGHAAAAREAALSQP